MARLKKADEGIGWEILAEAIGRLEAMKYKNLVEAFQVIVLTYKL